MKKWQSIFEYLLLGTLGLLVIFLIFSDSIVVPDLLKPLGRMHPLLLHLPIGFFLVLLLLLVFKKEFPEDTFQKSFGFLSLLNALLAVFTALFGILLSNESGYEPDTLNWHKWTGAIFALSAVILYFFYSSFSHRLYQLGLSFTALILIIAGHLGAEITHGENYLLEAWSSKETKPFDPEQPVYTQAIFPILEKKCISCHNDQKMKGQLNMASIDQLLKGGKNGPLWLAGDALNSHLTERINLPLEEKEHMPPKGKPQLTTQEIALITQWIHSGANLEISTAGLPENDTLRQMITGLYQNTDEKKYAFEAASTDLIEELNTPFCKLEPLSLNSPALEASFFVSQRFDRKSLQNLEKVAPQLVSLKLNKMPVKDEDLQLLSSFENLEELYLNQTEIKGAGLSHLIDLTKLEKLSLSGCDLEPIALEQIKKLTQLKEVYLWDTGVDTQKWQSELAGLKLIEGYQPDPEEKIKLNPPTVVNKNRVLKRGEKIELKHTLPGVKIVYTTDLNEPDTLKGDVYQSPLTFKGFGAIKAKAVKEGWLASETVSFPFFFSEIKADTAVLITKKNAQYPGNGAKTVIDLAAGDIDNFKDRSWLGYKDTHAEILIESQKEPNGLTVSFLVDAGSYIMPPVSVELWAGPSPNSMKLLGKKSPDQLKGYVQKRVDGLSFELTEKNKYIKLIARPIAKLPSWHAGSGQKGWVFIDEIYLW
ncbi:c-type cytochrome domain-containing protein [Jiulongibacter sediminis]|uniref:Cytochrome c domain-containing protein n=1 Tax=Jiulongibacter sediminis TaxID=1605367 RepID=A0A0N8H9M7_9BACT|nr:c-type cytochrome domain-containing protein [Jiulongibacter sediminis]KPM47804.1 hypothetical protein AFM12_11145 [Jiulongibacter sediminis]TBX23988.1 hypothetical protein TK44_11150 [Jiulongibacter sediminis]